MVVRGRRRWERRQSENRGKERERLRERDNTRERVPWRAAAIEEGDGHRMNVDGGGGDRIATASAVVTASVGAEIVATAAVAVTLAAEPSGMVPFTTMQNVVSMNIVESLGVPTFRVGYTITTDALDALYKNVKSENIEVDKENNEVFDDEDMQISPCDNKSTKENGSSESTNQNGGRDEAKKKDVKGIRAFKYSLVEFVKVLLKPTWKEGQITKED
ncbi:hypothetical protein RIF29_10979 [Crotalaria pallida]|uniref:Uncharacterized protein n=1 Tax=Crotalaria pallida TaxID=3830 RepID=A0AAN9IIP2_CROPI